MERTDQITVSSSDDPAVPSTSTRRVTTTTTSTSAAGGRRKFQPPSGAGVIGSGLAGGMGAPGGGMMSSSGAMGGFPTSGMLSAGGMDRTDTAMTMLHTGEIRPANVAPPSLGGHRWHSAGMTATVSLGGGAGAETLDGMFPQAPYRAGEERSVPFPPPPPPMRSPKMTIDDQYQRLMVWYQAVEVWCDEGATADNNRVIVAPPPRPPPFTNLESVVFRGTGALKAPYDVPVWDRKVRTWWTHVSRHFDKLRGEDRYETKGISKAPPSEIPRNKVLNHMAF